MVPPCVLFCMAANLQSRAFASFGKRFSGQIQSPFTLSRRVHISVYDKNPEENTHSAVVPDHVIPQRTDEYWAPHPKTGVFGPATNGHPSSVVQPSASAGSVLEEKAFFRPQEDLEKPPVQP